MMKYLKMVFLIISVFMIASFTDVKKYNVTLYLLPRGENKLVEVKKVVYASDEADLGSEIIDKIVDEQKLGYVPLISKKPEVKVKNGEATVKITQTHSEELEFLYSIVNSLTSTGDIITVKFVTNKNDFANVNINEFFIPNYDI